MGKIPDEIAALVVARASELVSKLDASDLVLVTTPTNRIAYEKYEGRGTKKHSYAAPADFLAIENLVDLKAELLSVEPDMEFILRMYLWLSRISRS